MKETPTTYLELALIEYVGSLWYDQFPDEYCWFMRLECLDAGMFKLGVL